MVDGTIISLTSISFLVASWGLFLLCDSPVSLGSASNWKFQSNLVKSKLILYITLSQIWWHMIYVTKRVNVGSMEERLRDSIWGGSDLCWEKGRIKKWIDFQQWRCEAGEGNGNPSRNFKETNPWTGQPPLAGKTAGIQILFVCL